MKKIILVLLMFVIVGCGTTKIEPIISIDKLTKLIDDNIKEESSGEDPGNTDFTRTEYLGDKCDYSIYTDKESQVIGLLVYRNKPSVIISENDNNEACIIKAKSIFSTLSNKNKDKITNLKLNKKIEIDENNLKYTIDYNDTFISFYPKQ